MSGTEWAETGIKASLSTAAYRRGHQRCLHHLLSGSVRSLSIVQILMVEVQKRNFQVVTVPIVVLFRQPLRSIRSGLLNRLTLSSHSLWLDFIIQKFDKVNIKTQIVKELPESIQRTFGLKETIVGHYSRSADQFSWTLHNRKEVIIRIPKTPKEKR